MRFAVETSGVIAVDPQTPDRAYLEQLFDRLAEALVEVSPFEADVAINIETHEVDFYIVAEAPTPQEAVRRAEEVLQQVLHRVGITEEPDWDEIHARRADLVPA